MPCNEPKSLTPLPASFYEPSAKKVAQKLLGHWLIRQTPEGPCGGEIVETEAYLVDDPACHAYRGLTQRNRVMFGPPGHAYVYFIYGNHCCVNAVCQPEGVAEAVLIRAIEARFGLEIMFCNRPVKAPPLLTSGPGKLCAALGIDRSLDGTELFRSDAPLIIAQNPQASGFCKEHGPVMITTRIGITQASHLPLRFYVQGSPFVSRRPIRNKDGGQFRCFKQERSLPS